MRQGGRQEQRAGHRAWSMMMQSNVVDRRQLLAVHDSGIVIATTHRETLQATSLAAVGSRPCAMRRAQLYTGNFLTGCKGKDGAAYNKHAAFCLETQHFPNSINTPTFGTPPLPPHCRRRRAPRFLPAF